MRLLITGFSGFVSTHFMDLLNTEAPGTHVLGIDKHEPSFSFSEFPDLTITYREIELLDRNLVANIIREFKPTHILHLASVSSVARSWEQPVESFTNNTGIFMNLADEVRTQQLKCRILSVGSSEEYGDVPEEQLPLTESMTLHPLSPYAVARVSQEMLSIVYAKGFGQEIVITRSFNHIGPGQRESFVISSFAKQLVRMAHNKGDQQLFTGDVDIARDFLDVRDVARAYFLLLMNGRSGEVYNICAGRPVQLREIISKLSSLVGANPEISIDPQRIRPNEIRKIYGSYQKIKDEVGWEPRITLDESLKDIVDYWKRIIG